MQEGGADKEAVNEAPSQSDLRLSIDAADISLLTALKELWEEVLGNSEAGERLFKGCKIGPIAAMVVYHFSAGMPSMINVIRPVHVPLAATKLVDYLQHHNKSVDAKEISTVPEHYHVIDFNTGVDFKASLKKCLDACGEKTLHMMQILLAVLPKQFAGAAEAIYHAQILEGPKGGAPRPT